MAEFWPVVFSLAQLASAYTLMKVVDRLDCLLDRTAKPGSRS